MAIEYGFSGLNKRLDTTTPQLDFLSARLNSLDRRFFVGRVTSIIADENSELFTTWRSVGTIQFEIVNEQTGDDRANLTATPLQPSLKQYPLLGEQVLIFKAPSSNQGNDSSAFQYYYLSAIGIWNHPHHNAYPNLVKSEQQEEFGGTFVEKANIHPILPFTGDTILEGRYGNSIRLGNTAQTDSQYSNNWSDTGENGDPITILRNGQPEDQEPGWEPVTENIANDLSSLYLTSTQQIGVNAVTNYSAFNTQPEYPSAYSSNQAILNSGRLVLNAQDESVLISGRKSISLSAVEDIGISTRDNVVLVGNEVKLGSPNANQSLVRGDAFVEQFKLLLTNLSLLCNSLSLEPTLTLTPVQAQVTKGIIDTVNDLSDTFLSQNSKTI